MHRTGTHYSNRPEEWYQNSEQPVHTEYKIIEWPKLPDVYLFEHILKFI